MKGYWALGVVYSAFEKIIVAGNADIHLQPSFALCNRHLALQVAPDITRMRTPSSQSREILNTRGRCSTQFLKNDLRML